VTSSPPDRLVIVSNRLPVAVRRHDGTAALADASGGLATGLRPLHEATRGVWIGWPGESLRGRGAADPEVERLLEARRLVPVHLTAQEVRQYYEGFSNGVIWPLFHYLLDRVPLGDHEWEAYRAVNERFADVVARHANPGDTIWIHDYQLMLLPGLVRQRVPGARIGFFLHVPFPSSELFRILPWRRELLEGLLGADLIGFHTHAYARHFVVAVRQILGLDPAVDRIAYGERQVRFSHFPMGIDAEGFERRARQPAVVAASGTIRREAGDRQVLLGIDRLDYTKGIPRRLLAFERLLEHHPDLRSRVRLIQVAVPSRSGIEPYQAIRRQVEEIVGRINGRFGTLGSAPVHYLYQAVSPTQLAALYRAADVMLVTPLRDGMNLVAKEFVASRPDEDGVLVLSEFAGAAAELGEAVSANPFDIDAMAAVFRRALEMEPLERRTRMRELRQRVRRQTVQRWADSFLGALRPARATTGRVQMMAGSDILALARRVQAAERKALLFDYDGTLVPFAQAPDLARPDADLLRLLEALALSSRAVHVVSGRPRDTLERWLGHLPVHLWAEHGAWHRPADAKSWTVREQVPTDWLRAALAILEPFTTATPGSLIETKEHSIAWHYRMADQELGVDHARQLRRALTAGLRGQPIDILDGHKVVEVRPQGANKGAVVRQLLAATDRPPLILAVGDDRTDEDMFTAMPPSGISVRVGHGPTVALHCLPDPGAVRQLVRLIA
jgi:trehalose 6-phosphate synthase/phosphatase